MSSKELREAIAFDRLLRDDLDFTVVDRPARSPSRPQPCFVDTRENSATLAAWSGQPSWRPG
jgi:hypothetical protein